MNPSFFCPPNSHLLSDKATDVVARRPRKCHRSTSGKAFCQFVRSHWDSKLIQPAAGANTPGDANRKRNETVIQLTPVAPKHDHDYASIVEMLELGRRIQRKKKREIQRRSRKKKNELLNILDTTTKQLRDEVDQLQKRRSRITGVLLSKKGIWSVAVEYFRLFRRGLELRPRLTKDAATRFEAQRDFVQRSMSSDVASAAGIGPDAIMKTWSILQFFGNVEVQDENMAQNAGYSLIVSTRTSVTITSETLRVLFPHLCSDGSDKNLMFKLLNQRIVLSGTTTFQWDNVSERVTSVMTQSDFLTPMLQLLGNLEAVAYSFGQTLISLDGRCR